MKYKVGDKVRIKSLDWYGKYANKNGIIVSGNYYFTQNMLKYCGKVLMITNVIRDFYVCKDIDYQFSDEMIEGLAEEPIILNGKEVMLKLADIELPSGTTNIWKCPEGYIFKDEHGNVINATKIVLEKKKKEYPKTYEECCGIIGFCFDTLKWDNPFRINRDTLSYIKHLDNLMESFCKLLVCRDAYWKIAGEAIGLGKPWKPDWEDGHSEFYVIVVRKINGVLIKEDSECFAYRYILVFPTAEMRDAFYENFKELINEVKELL